MVKLTVESYRRLANFSVQFGNEMWVFINHDWKNLIHKYVNMQLAITIKYQLTLQRTEKLQTSFVVRHWPSESIDWDRASGSREESKEFLDNLSELLTAPLIP